MKPANSLKAAISMVQEPESCSSMFAMTASGMTSRYGAITLSRYSAAACRGSRFATLRCGASGMGVPRLDSSVANTS